MANLSKLKTDLRFDFFFSNIVQNFQITKLFEIISTMIAILQYKNHLSIVFIRNQCKNRASFTKVDKKRS